MIVIGLASVVTVALMVWAVTGRAESVQMAYVHMALAGLMAVVFVLAYLLQNRALVTNGASSSRVAANTSRSIGMVWLWGALGLAATYATGILSWREWPVFLAACIVIAGLCLLFAAMLDKDARQGREDATMLRLGRILALVLLIGMLIAIVGLIIDGKMTRFLVPRYTDWPANNIFFFGAVAMALISGRALLNKPQAADATS